MADNVGMMQRVLGKHVRVSFHTPIAPSTPPLFGGSLEADVFAVDVALKQVVLRRAIPHTVSKADYFVVACDVIESVALLRDADPSGAAPALQASLDEPSGLAARGGDLFLATYGHHAVLQLAGGLRALASASPAPAVVATRSRTRVPSRMAA